MTPGPVEVPERVLRAQARPLVSHRSPEFRRLLAGLLEGLRELSGAEEALVLAGTGTTAVDALAWGLVEPGSRVLVVSVGEFGERLAESLARRGASVTVVRGGPAEAAARALEALESGRFDYLAVVQNETSNGTLLAELGELARAAASAGARVVVDAVSAFPVEPLDFRYVYAAAACSHKALAAPPGAAVVLLSGEAARRLEERGSPPAPPALDLARYLRFARERRETPYTPPITVLYALAEAVSAVLEQGLGAFREAHARRAGLLYGLLEARGVRPLPDPRHRSRTVAAFRLPPGVDARAVVEHVRRRGYVIATGMGREARSVVRVGVMGAVTEDDVRAVAEAVAEAAGAAR